MAPAERVKDRVAIVTGGGSANMPNLAKGIGESIAELLAAEGGAVAVVDREPRAAEATVAAIRSAGATAVPVIADLSVPSECSRAVSEAIGQLGRPSILVNNLGITGLSESLDEWDHLMATNVRSHALMSEAFVKNSVSPASIVNISSIAAFRPPAKGNLGYPASKGAVVALTTALAVKYGHLGVRVNCICPGSVWTPIVIRNVLGANPEPGAMAELREKRRRRTLLDTEGTGRDIAYAVLFLVSEESRWITAQTITVDGGALAAPF